MHINLPDHRLKVTTATLFAGLVDPYWQKTYDGGVRDSFSGAVRIEAEEVNISDGSYEPSFSFERLVFPIKNWRELTGKTFHFTSPFDHAHGPRAMTYFWSHEDISHAQLHFVERNGRDFLIQINGTCNPYIGGIYETDVPFSLEAQVTLSQIYVGGSSYDDDETIAQRLASHIDLTDLIQHPIECFGNYESGVGMCKSIFEVRAD